MYLGNKNILTIEKMFVNGIIYSIDKKGNVYEAMGISQGRIVFLGTNNEAMNLIENNTIIIDLKHRAVLPGFIDAYTSFPKEFIKKDDELNLCRCSCLDEYLSDVHDYINKYSNKEFIYGYGWDNNKMPYTEEFFKGPYKKYLNDLSFKIPIVLEDITGSMLWLNDKGFEYYKINKNLESPIGGIIELDERGELWGILKGNAKKIIQMEKFNRYSNKECLEGFLRFQNELHSNGITSIGLVESSSIDIPFDIYRLAEIKDKLKLRINYGIKMFPYEIEKKSIYEQVHEIKRLKIIYKSRYFDITRICFKGDGLIETHDAFLFKPYKNCNNEYSGRFKWEFLEFKEAIKMANRLDFDAVIECCGDNGCRAAIDGIEYSQKNNNYNKCRNSIAHLDLITKYYIRRMKLLNINAIIIPFWHYQNQRCAEEQYRSIGEERVQRLYPYRSLIENNIITAGASEHYRNENISPLKGIWCSMTRNLCDFKSGLAKNQNIMTKPQYRLNPCEKINLLQAVRSFTIEAAYILGKEKEIGSLEIGKKADFIVLDQNIFEVDPEEIKNIHICDTYFEGDLVYTNV